MVALETVMHLAAGSLSTSISLALGAGQHPRENQLRSRFLTILLKTAKI